MSGMQTRRSTASCCWCVSDTPRTYTRTQHRLNTYRRCERTGTVNVPPPQRGAFGEGDYCSSSHHLASQTGSLLSEPLSGRKKIISNTKLSVYTRKMRGKIWLPELGGAQTRVLLCAKETKALPLWPWINTKHGAELLNGGAIASDTCRCHSITVISNYDSHLVGSQGFWRKSDDLLEMQCNDKIWGNTLKEDLALREDVNSTHFCLEGVNTECIWTSPPFSMAKADLYFIGFHTWKKFTPYA